jgi:hypothetical protein
MARQQLAPAKAKKEFPRFWGLRLRLCACAVAVAVAPAVRARGAVAASASMGFPDPGPVPRLVELVCSTVPLVVLCPCAAPTPQPAPGVSSAPAPLTPQPDAHRVAPLRPTSTPSVRESPPRPAAFLDTRPVPAPQTTPSELSARPAPPAPGPRASGSRPPAPHGSRVQGVLLTLPREIDVTTRNLLVAAGLGIAGLLAIGFPADLFNRTLRTNYGRLARLFPWIGKRAMPSSSMARQLAAFFMSCAVAGVIGSLQRAREWSTEGAIMIAASVTFGYVVNTAAYEAAARTAGAHLGLPRRQFRVFPGALPLVAGFVAISYLGQLQPAYLYGNLSGSVASSDNPPPARARALQTVAASLALMGVGMLCWAARDVVSSPLMSSLLAGCAVVALSRLAFGLAPIAYFDGAIVAVHSRLMWTCLYGPALALFALLILLPAAKRAPAAGVLGAALLPFLSFAALSLGLWLWFRWTPGEQSR